MIQLRDYQDRAVAEIRAALLSHKRVLFQLPTGGGKTVIFAFVAQRVVARGRRAVVLAHRREIVEQISKTLRSFGVAHGVIAPGEPPTTDAVQVAMVQTLARRVAQHPAPDLIVVDEAHHAVAGSWRRITDAWPHARVLGVTATPERLDGKGLGDVFETLVQGPPMAALIRDGYLAPYTYLAPPTTGVDLSDIGTRGGDYALGELARRLNRPTITGSAVEHYRRHLDGRPALAFCTSIEHAVDVAATFQSVGYRAASISGDDDRRTRERLLGDLAIGLLNVLTSAELISEGVDVPVVSGAILLRPTKSVTVYLQQVGRALRPKPDGTAALILDHVGNHERHGLPADPRAWSLEGRTKRDAPAIRQCQTCYRVVPAGTPPCEREDCGLRRAVADDGGGRARPDEVDGTLHVVEDPLAWAAGLDVALARGDEFRALLERAGDDVSRLKQIARARGYHHGWIKHIVRHRTLNADRRAG